jgi:phosphoribosylaminoimidazolecarboxamide formyltransferase / IMP cyclohydrolase
MGKKTLSSMYRRIEGDSFPAHMELSFYDNQSRQTLIYEKVQWTVDGETRGLRYGENPGQEAAMYRLVNGNLCLGDVRCIQPGRYLASDVELLQSGKHPGKINITDVDSALNILRYLADTPSTVIVKHNNPCGVAKGDTAEQSYTRALAADRIAAFGGAVALNRAVDQVTAERIVASYLEVVAAPEFAPGVMDVLAGRKNLRVLRIENMRRLAEFAGERVVDLKSLIDGGIIAQWSFAPQTRDTGGFQIAVAKHEGTEVRIQRAPTEGELQDMLFGWLVEAGVTSNSVLYVKDGVTVGIGTGEQDRVGVAEIARDKAYRNLADRISWEEYQTPWYQVSDPALREEILQRVRDDHGGLSGSVMISDAFFPFRDGVDVGIREGVTAIVQPGGALRDHECIQACNEANVTMVFTGQRSFRH